MRIIKNMMMLFALIAIGCGSGQKGFDPEYVKVTNERAQRIVDDLGISSGDKEIIVRDIIAKQYRNLSRIQDDRDAKIQALDAMKMTEIQKDEAIDKITSKAQKKIDKLHSKYIKALERNLTEQQVVQVKDGMTYGVVPLTYKGYLEMLPALTKEQKEVIYNYLVEAREYAMDAGSSDKKHWWFGKYKGKINNYLSAQGYDLNKASKDWQARIRAEKNN